MVFGFKVLNWKNEYRPKLYTGLLKLSKILSFLVREKKGAKKTVILIPA